MAITLNGIAQGFAADRACQAMRAAGAVAGLVDAGELASLGRALSGAPWSVALQVLHHGREERIALDACVATSADSPSYFSADRRHHHIFDPHSGWSPTSLSGVSVFAVTATQADAWSTAIMVGGETLARHALARREVQRVWLVDKQGRASWLS
jgi:thiamine biosynthesis lipoprotein